MNHFERPLLLILIPVLLVYAFVYYKLKLHELKNTISIASQKSEPHSKIINLLIQYFPFLRFVILILFIIAAAGPGFKSEFQPNEKTGIDIMIVLDASGSMIESMDFLPSNRLEVSKKLVQDFISKRKNDRIGFIVFAGAAYLQAPLTNDVEALKEIISDVNKNSIEEQGTAIGDAILLATYRLKKSTARSRIIVLLTDGVSNAGKVDVKTAAETAKAFDIKIYTIGIGKDFDSFSETDFQSLQEISNLTNAKFYRAIDSEQLQRTLEDINSLEKDILATPPKIIMESKYLYFLVPAILLLALDLFIRAYVWKFFI
ncbi:MAG: VWA domain-containing protein [Leptospiraceae bacterium]|nr:VWA domain-containing protein [Leptospiraceae bacterium]